MIPTITKPLIENSVLASALFVDGAVNDMAYELKLDDFTTDFNRALFKELMTCSVKGYKPDMNLIIGRLEHLYESENTMYVNSSINGNLAMMMGELSLAATSTNIKPWIEELKANTDARNIIKIATAVMSSANNITDAKDWVKESVGKLNSVARTGNPKSELKHITSYIPQAISRFESIIRGEIPGMKTGIPAIDEQTGGVRKGEYVIIGGRPGGGKTSLGLTIAKNLSLAGHRGGIFSIEVGGDDIVLKLCSMISSNTIEIPYSVFRGRDKAEEHHIQSFTDTLAKLESLGIFINDSGKTTCSDIMIELRRFIVSEKLDYVVIDSLGLVKKEAHHQKQKRNEFLQDISISFMECFKEFNVAGFVLIQLARNKENKVPTMDSLAECSQFEKDAHLIYLIHIPDLNNVGYKLLCCVKGRDTGIGNFPVNFSTRTTEFTGHIGIDHSERF